MCLKPGHVRGGWYRMGTVSRDTIRPKTLSQICPTKLRCLAAQVSIAHPKVRMGTMKDIDLVSAVGVLHNAPPARHSRVPPGILPQCPYASCAYSRGLRRRLSSGGAVACRIYIPVGVTLCDVFGAVAAWLTVHASLSNIYGTPREHAVDMPWCFVASSTCREPHCASKCLTRLFER